MEHLLCLDIAPNLGDTGDKTDQVLLLHSLHSRGNAGCQTISRQSKLFQVLIKARERSQAVWWLGQGRGAVQGEDI